MARPYCELWNREIDEVAPSGLFFLGGFYVGNIAKRCPYNLLIVSWLSFACLVLRAVAATAVFVELEAVGVAIE